LVTCHVIDSSALLAIGGCTSKARFPELLNSLTARVQDSILWLPRAVVKELSVMGRDESVTFWGIGLGNALRPFSADIEHKIAIMHELQLEMGYEEGIEDVDGSEPAIVEVCAIAHMLRARTIPFRIISEDRGLAPLRPTMAEMCAHFEWVMVDVREGLKGLDLEEYLT
jgi:hypothetical protein